MCLKCREPRYVKAECPLFSKGRYEKGEEEGILLTLGGIDSEREDESYEERESISCFIAISN